MEFEVSLTSRNVTYERRAYTLLDLFGDFGGYYDALKLIFGIFTLSYSSTMYNASISNEFATTVNIEEQKRSSLSSL